MPDMNDEWVGNPGDPVRIVIVEDAITIHDRLGEIVTWVSDEWEEDCNVPTVIASAIVDSMEFGGSNLRRTINHPIQGGE